MEDAQSTFILDIGSRSSIDDRRHKASNAALAGIMFEVFDNPKTHKDGDVFVITDCDGDEVGRGPTEQAAIYDAIKAEHRRMVTRLRKSDAFRKSMREFMGGE